MKRKEALQLLGLGSMMPLTMGMTTSAHNTGQTLKGNINHSACRWCYESIPLEQLADHSKNIGLKGLDLLKPSEWKTVMDKGLTCSMATPEAFSLTDGFNDPALHEALQNTYASLIPAAAEIGIENIICFSGNRKDLDDEKGLENCAKGLAPLVKAAEQNNVTLHMELLNSKVDHKDYQCDHTSWGVQLCEKIGSPNFKLLYDIYHMQIMEGDIIATIRQHYDYIGHFHTGGVPGRHEINETQELFYPAIMQAIVDLGFQGYVAQEFIPERDPLPSLRAAVRICDV